MSQQFNNQNLQTKVSLLVFVKGSVAPVVLYFDDPQKAYQNIQNIIQTPQTPKLLEVEAIGPIKKVSLLTSEIIGCALQEEIHIGK